MWYSWDSYRAFMEPPPPTLPMHYPPCVVQDTTDLEKTAETSTQYIMLVFYVISTFAIILCTFMLWLSFKANVMHNSWEFGVVRSIGLNVNAVIRVYIYEALCTVASGFTLGTIIGFVVAFTLTLQYNLFSEMPLSLAFPWTLFFIAFVLSVLSAFCGSYTAAIPLKKKRIASVLKGL